MKLSEKDFSGIKSFLEDNKKEFQEKKKLFLLAVLPFLFLVFLLEFLPSVYSTYNNIPSSIVFSEYETSKKTSVLEPGETHTYTISTETDFDELEIKLFSSMLRPNVSITLYDIDAKKSLTAADEFVKYYVDSEGGSTRYVHIPYNQYVKKQSRFDSGKYKISITNNEAEAIELNITESNTLVFQTTGKTKVGELLYFVIMIPLLIFIVVFLKILSNKNDNISTNAKYALALIPLLIIYFLLTTPWSTAGADADYCMAYKYSNRILFHNNYDSQIFSSKDGAFFNSYFGTVADGTSDPELSDYEVAKSMLSFKRTNKLVSPRVRFDDSYSSYNYLSFFNYLPQITGLTIARLIGLNSLMAMNIARLFTMIAYVLGFILAIKITPIGKNMFMLISLFPTSLALSSSLSSDTMALIIAMNFIALVLRLRDVMNDRRSSDGEKRLYLILLLLITFILGSLKGGALIILMPLLLLLYSSYEKKQSIIYIICTLIITGVSVTLFNVLLPDTNFFTDGKSAGNLYMAYAYTKPFGYLGLALATSFKNFFAFIGLSVGRNLTLGGTEVISRAITVWMIISTLVLGLTDNDSVNTLKKRPVWIISLVTFVLGMLFIPAYLLKGTTEGANTIAGVNGWYFLMILPLLFIVLTKFKVHTLLHTNTKIKKYSRYLIYVRKLAILAGSNQIKKPRSVR